MKPSNSASDQNLGPEAGGATGAVTVAGGIPEGTRESAPTVDGFEIGPELGRGGMGVVYEALELSLNRKVALKILPTTAGLSSVQIRRFLTEAKAVAALSHDHIVPLHRVGMCGNTHFYTMKLIQGLNLAQVIKTAKQAVGRNKSKWSKESTLRNAATSTLANTTDDRFVAVDLSGSSFSQSMSNQGTRSARKIAQSVARVGAHAAQALQHAHENGVIHRDIKPSNLLLDTAGKIWITDFGLALLQDAASVTQTGDIIGTLHYMSPEQASGRRAFVDHRTDIYSLGVTLYELATLRRACRGQTVKEVLREITFERPTPIRKLNPRLPGELETIICKATERNPSDRYQSAAEMAADLNRYLDGQPLAARRLSRWKRVRDWLYDRPGTASVMAISMMLLLAISSIFAGISHHRFVLEQARRLRAEGGRLLALSALYPHRDPGLAMALTILGARGAPGFEADQAIMTAVDGSHELHTIPKSPTSEGAIIFSPDGKRVLLCNHPAYYAHGPAEAVLLDAESRQQLRTFHAPSPITTAVFSPDGRYLLTGSSSHSYQVNDLQEGVVVLWNVEDGQEIKRFPGMRLLNFRSQAFSSHSARRLVLPTDAGDAVVFDDRWEVVARIARPNDAIIDICFSPDGERMAAVLAQGMVVVYDRDGNELFNHTAAASLHRRMSFSLDSRQLLVTDSSGARLYSLQDQDADPVFFDSPLAQLSPDGRLLYVATGVLGEYHIQIRDLASRQTVGVCSSSQPIQDFVLSDSGDYVIAACGADAILFDARTGDELAVCSGHEEPIRNLAIRPFAQEFVTNSWDGTVRFWETRSNLERRTSSLVLHRSSQRLAGFSDSGRLLTASSIVSDATVVLSHDGLRNIARIKGELKEVMPDGRIVILHGDTLSIWSSNGQLREISRTISGYRIEDVKACSGSDLLLLRTLEGELLLWDIARHELLNITQFGEIVAQFDVAQDSSVCLFSLKDGSLHSYDLHSRIRAQVRRFAGKVLDFKIATDNNSVALLTAGGEALVWGLAESRPLHRFSLGDQPKQAVEFARNDTCLVTFEFGQSPEAALQLWEISSGDLIAQLPIAQPSDFAFDAEHNRIALATEQGVVEWNLQSGEQIQITHDACVSLKIEGGQLFVALNAPSARAAPNAGPEQSRNKVQAWDIDAHTLVSEYQNLAIRTRLSCTSSKTQNLVLSGKTFGAAVFDPDTMRVAHECLGHTTPLRLAEFVNNDRQIVTVPEQGVILLHDLESDSRIEIGEYQDRIEAAALAEDRKILIVAAGGVLSQWDIKTREPPKSLPLGEEEILNVTFDRNGNQVLAVQKTIATIWDLRLDSHRSFDFEKAIQVARLSPDGKLLLVVPSNNLSEADNSRVDEQVEAAVLIDLDSDERRAVELSEAQQDARFVNGSTTIAFLSGHGQINIVNTENLEVTRTIEHKNIIHGLLPTRSGSPFVAGVLEGNICVWDSLTGTQVMAMDEIELTRPEARYRLKNWTLESANSDCWIGYSDSKLFTRPKTPLDYAIRIAPRELTPSEKKHFRVPEEFLGQAL